MATQPPHYLSPSSQALRRSRVRVLHARTRRRFCSTPSAFKTGRQELTFKRRNECTNFRSHYFPENPAAVSLRLRGRSLDPLSAVPASSRSTPIATVRSANTSAPHARALAADTPRRHRGRGTAAAASVVDKTRRRQSLSNVLPLAMDAAASRGPGAPRARRPEGHRAERRAPRHEDTRLCPQSASIRATRLAAAGAHGRRAAAVLVKAV